MKTRTIAISLLVFSMCFTSCSNNGGKLEEIEKQVIDYSYDLDLEYDILLSPIIENIENYKNRTRYMAFYKNIEKEGVLLNG